MVFSKAPGSAGVAALIGGPVIYGIFQAYATQIHFLIQVLLTFVLVVIIMVLITVLKPLKEPKVLPVREDLDLTTSPVVKLVGGLVIAGVAVFYLIFW